MRAKITTSLGYTLLTGAAIGGLIYTKTDFNYAQIAQFMVLGAGAVALLLMTRQRSAK
jgi:hypothetical protein